MTGDGQTIDIYPGDSVTFSVPILLPNGGNPSYTAPVGAFVITNNFNIGPDYLIVTGVSLVNTAGAWSMPITFTSAQTATLPFGGWRFQIRITDVGGTENTVATGFCNVLQIRPTA